MDVLNASPVGHPFEYDPETTTFVACSKTAADRKLLVGYGFAGRDMVIGEEGRISWETATGRAFTGGEDGTYAIVSQTGATIHIKPILPGTCRYSIIRSGLSRRPPIRSSA